MNVNTLRFKPGVRTSLNSGADIKPNFAKQKSGEGGLAAVGKTQSASRTAAANLSNSTLTNVNWQGQDGSVFGGRASQATSLLGNGTQRTSSYTAKGSTTLQRNNKYVSSGYWNKLENDSNMGRSVYMGYTDYGYTRDFGSTGGTRRSGMRYDQRMNDYNQYVYDQLHPKTKKSFWQKLGDVVGGVAAGVGVVAGVVGLFKGKKSGSAQQTTQGNAGSPTSTQQKSSPAGNGTVTSDTPETSTPAISTSENSSSAISSRLKVAQERRKAIPNEITDKAAKIESPEIYGLKQLYENYKELYEIKEASIPTLKTETSGAKNRLEFCQRDFDLASKNLQDIETALSQATDSAEIASLNTQKQYAESLVEQARTALDSAKEDYNTAQQDLQKAIDDSSKLKSNMDDAKDEYDEALKKSKEAEKRVEQLQAEAKELDKTIPKLKEQLEKAEQKENAKMEKLKKQKAKANEAETKALEAGKTNKAGRKDAKVKDKDAQLTAYQRMQAIRDMKPTSSEIVGGNEFKTVTLNGETVYVINGIEVLQSEYEEQLNTAKGKNE